MRQTYEDNKRRIKAFKLTADVKDDNGVVHHFFEGYEYVEIGGIKWATCNVGAEKETDGGLYFQWGETKGYVDANEKHFTCDDYKFGDYFNISKYNELDGLTKLEPCYDAVTANMGESWRMPTSDEFNYLLYATTNKRTTVNGVNGRLFTDKTDSSKKLFFQAVGYCSYGTVYDVGRVGNYWSNSLDTSNAIYAKLLSFGYTYCCMDFGCRLIGYPVRGVIK